MAFTRSVPEEDIPADIAQLVRIGTVTVVDLVEARCIVRYGDPDEDEPAETPPIRWLQSRAGATRSWSPPTIGEQVLILAPDGQIGSAIALAGIVQDAFPSLGWQSEQGFEFSDGAKITYDPERSALSAMLPAGATALVEAPGGITLRGPLTVEGDVTIDGAATATGKVEAGGDMIASGISLTNHTHGAVAAGTAQTAKPQ